MHGLVLVSGVRAAESSISRCSRGLGIVAAPTNILWMHQGNVQEYLEASPCIDVIVRGDGEEIVQDIFSGTELSRISGISYRRNGKIIHNETGILPKVRDFYPDRTLRRYRYRHRTILGLSFGVDTVMSSWG